MVVSVWDTLLERLFYYIPENWSYDRIIGAATGSYTATAPLCKYDNAKPIWGRILALLLDITEVYSW